MLLYSGQDYRLRPEPRLSEAYGSKGDWLSWIAP